MAPLPLAVEDFLVWLGAERGRSASTVAAYRRDLGSWCSWLDERDRDPVTATTEDVQAWVGHLASTRAPATTARATAAARTLHRFLVREGVRADDPAVDVRAGPVPQRLPKALSEGEVAALVEVTAADPSPLGRRDLALVEVLYGTGCRISEAVGLSLGDVDLDGRLLRVLGKGARERVVPVGRHAAAALEAWLGPGGRPELVPARWASRDHEEALLLGRRGHRLSRQAAWAALKQRAVGAGVADRLSPHVLRHSCATHMLDHGADIRTVGELLGHASVSTTQVYTKVTPERLRQVVDRAHPRARRG